MKVQITADRKIADSLRDAIASDPKVIRVGPFKGYSTLSYYANMMTLTTTSGYVDGISASQCNLKIPTRRLLSRVVEGTWLANRDDQPGTPNAAIIVFDPAETDLVVTYYTGDDALEWNVTDENRQAIRERLRPPSVEPPSASGTGPSVSEE